MALHGQYLSPSLLELATRLMSSNVQPSICNCSSSRPIIDRGRACIRFAVDHEEVRLRSAVWLKFRHFRCDHESIRPIGQCVATAATPLGRRSGLAEGAWSWKGRRRLLIDLTEEAACAHLLAGRLRTGWRHWWWLEQLSERNVRARNENSKTGGRTAKKGKAEVSSG